MFTATYAGFKNGESLATSDMTGDPSLTCAASSTSLTGTYPIVAAQGTLVANNYTFTFVNGTLTVVASPTSFVATTGDDTFKFTAGSTWHEVVVTLSGDSPTTYLYPTSGNINITFDGLGGNDAVTLKGGSGDFTADLYPDHGTLTGSNYTVSVTGVASIAVTGGGGNDQVTLHDGAGTDSFFGTPTYALLTGTGVSLSASGFRSVIADATAGGQDAAYLYDSAGDDAFTASPTGVTLTTSGGTLGLLAGYNIQANDFRFCMAYATHGGTDAAAFSDSPGNDTFATYPTYATMTGSFVPAGDTTSRSYFNRAEGFGAYQGTSSAGGASDLAKLYDSATTSATDDQFVAGPTQGTFTGGGGGFSSQATGFRYLCAYSTGGADSAELDDSTGTDTFVASPTYGVMYAAAGTSNPAYLNRTTGFKVVNAFSTHGGGDSARLYDSVGNDLFTATPTDAQLTNDPATNPTSYFIKASAFLTVQGFSTAGGADKAVLTGSSGADTFYSDPTYARLYNLASAQPFFNQANFFAQVLASEGPGNTAVATLSGSAGQDLFTFHAPTNIAPTSDGQMSGSGHLSHVQGFRYVLASATGGDDEADLYDSNGDDKLYANGTTARLYDTAMAAYLASVQGFQHVNVSASTGTDTRWIVKPVDYSLLFSGTWLGDPWP